MDDPVEAKVVSNVNKIVVVCAAILLVLVGIRYLIINPIVTALVNQGNTPSPGPTPVVVSTWEADLTAALKKENNPERVEQLRNLWAGLGHIMPNEATAIIQLQRMNALAGTLAISGLGPRNPEASQIVQDQFGLLIAGMTDPLDDVERAQIKKFFLQLEQAAEGALR